MAMDSGICHYQMQVEVKETATVAGESTLVWDTYYRNGRSTMKIKPQLWVNSPTALWVPWEWQRLGEYTLKENLE